MVFILEILMLPIFLSVTYVFMGIYFICELRILFIDILLINVCKSRGFFSIILMNARNRRNRKNLSVNLMAGIIRAPFLQCSWKLIRYVSTFNIKAPTRSRTCVNIYHVD